MAGQNEWLYTRISGKKYIIIQPLFNDQLKIFSIAKAWTLSSRSIEDPLSMAGQTLAPLYTSRPGDEMVRVLYNDELPDGPTSFNLGHTKVWRRTMNHEPWRRTMNLEGEPYET